MSRLPRSTPEEQGVASSAILDFIGAVESDLRDVHSLMLIRHGHVIAEGWWDPYGPDSPHSMFSVSKSFTSSAVGFAVAEGLLSVEDTVVSLLPDDVPATIGANLAAMRVRDLLTMTTGHAADSMGVADRVADDNWARAILAQPVPHEPGTRFVYNSGASYLLSAILQRLTGQRLLDYLTPRLLHPLGIEGASWETCPRGIDVGGWGLSIITEDLAKLGLLYLQGGAWDGRQLLPADWAAAATIAQVPNDDPAAGPDSVQGYGYQFWRSRHGAYRADGAFGQVSLVLPDQDAVFAMTAGLDFTQEALELAWTHLLPAFAAGASPGVGVSTRLDHLVLPLPAGAEISPVANELSGRYLFDGDSPVAAVSIATEPRRIVVVITDEHGEHRITCGFGEWITGRTRHVTGDDSAVAASYAWTDDRNLVVRLCFYETPFTYLASFGFSGAEVLLDLSVNVSFGQTELARVVGRLENSIGKNSRTSE